MSMNIGTSSGFSYMNSFLVQESIALMFVALGLASSEWVMPELKAKNSFNFTAG